MAGGRGQGGGEVEGSQRGCKGEVGGRWWNLFLQEVHTQHKMPVIDALWLLSLTNKTLRILVFALKCLRASLY